MTEESWRKAEARKQFNDPTRWKIERGYQTWSYDGIEVRIEGVVTYVVEVIWQHPRDRPRTLPDPKDQLQFESLDKAKACAWNCVQEFLREKDKLLNDDRGEAEVQL